MSSSHKSLEMVNKIIAGGEAPDYDPLDSGGISKATHITYCETASRLVAYFGHSDQPFKSIGQMKRLSKLCSGKKKIKLFSKIPLSTQMSKASLIRVIEYASPLITESEIVRGCLLMPDFTKAEKLVDITSVARSFLQKIFNLNITTFDEFALIAESELIAAYEATRNKWADYLGQEFKSASSIKFWLIVFCMVHEVGSKKAKYPSLRVEMTNELAKAEKAKNGFHYGVSGAIRDAIQKGRLS